MTAEPENDQPTSKAALWDIIRAAGGKESFVLSEMIRLGFWDVSKPEPKLAKDFIERRTELQRELADLVREHSKYADRDKMLAEIHKKRKAEAKERRKETRERRECERRERAERWARVKASDIPYLGERVSAGLGTDETHPGRLSDLGLPVINSVEELARAVNVKVGRLRFLAFHRKVSKISHYRRFYMPKKTGGQRLISAPMPQLKFVQHWLLEHLLSKVALHEAAHGFVTNRSICSNAAPHIGADVVVNMDLKDFFPTITYPRVKGMYRCLGYSEKMATILALICTEPDVDELELDGETYYLHKGERHLPQGAPTSPAITNIICRRFDARMQGVANQMGLRYTRYADDLTFSGGEDFRRDILRLIWRAQAVIRDEGFIMHPDKLRIMHKGSRQEVTGVVVNEKLNVKRATLKRFRALLHQVEKDGPGGKHWNKAPNLLASMYGYAHFIHMVNPERGAPILAQVNAILKANGWKHKIRHPAKGYIMPDHRPEPKPTASGPTSGKEGAKKPWWKFW